MEWKSHRDLRQYWRNLEKGEVYHASGDTSGVGRFRNDFENEFAA